MVIEIYSLYRNFDFRPQVTYRRIFKEEYLNEFRIRWNEEERRWKVFTLRFGEMV